MSDFDRHAHWEGVYASKKESELSWFEATPQMSLDLIRQSGVEKSSAIVDIGAGASHLVYALMDRG